MTSTESLEKQCQICDRTFHKIMTYYKHMYYHRQIKKTYECETCSKTFTSLPGINYHKKSHTRVATDRVICDICEKTCSSEAALKQHKKYNHEFSKDRVSCEECGKSFKRMQGLKLHKETVHKEKSHQEWNSIL